MAQTVYDVATIDTSSHKPSKHGTILFISNLNTVHTASTRSQLRALLKPYGLKKLTLPCNHYGHLRGYAFATLQSAEYCTATIEQLHCNATINDHVLYVSHTLGKIDVIYPLLQYDVRKQVQCDSYALIGTTDQLTALRISNLLYNVTHCVTNRTGSPYSVLDCTACIGTQTIALSEQFDTVTGCELDATRYSMLQHNVQLLCHYDKISTVQCDSNKLLNDCSRRYTVVMIDPMWQAANESYTDESVIPAHSIALGTVPVTDIVQQLRRHDTCSVVCLGLPYNYDVTSLAQLCTTPVTTSHNSQSTSTLDERPLPFKLEFGKRVLFVLCMPCTIEYDSTQRRQLEYSNETLDTVIATLQHFNQLYKLDHKPAFYDYEKQRWIDCMRWRGNTQQPAVKQGMDVD